MKTEIPETARFAKTAGTAGGGRESAPLEFSPRAVVIASLIATVLLAVAGSLGDICLGDECAHIRHVRAYVATGARTPFDPTFMEPGLVAVPFSGTPLWHAGLAVLWWLAGTPSQVIAQTYHAAFFLLLVLSVYFTALHIWDKVVATWAWLLIATVPMFCAYSILLYQDVPGVAVAALAFLLLWRKQFFWGGVCLAAAYFTKMNELTYAPWAILFALAQPGVGWRRRLASAALVALPVAVLLAYDFEWRFQIFNSFMGAGYFNVISIPAGLTQSLVFRPTDYSYWKPFRVTEPWALLTHIGAPFLLATVLALLRSWDKPSRWVWLAAGIGIAGFLKVFLPTGCTQTRYVMPVLLAVALVGGKALAGWSLPQWLRVALVAALVLQAAAATGYVVHQRHISAADAGGYAWIRDNTVADARVLFPEQAITNETGRPFVWDLTNPAYFLTDMPDDEREAVLRTFNITYIAIPLRRTYDRAEEGAHAGGYEKHFVEKARAMPFLERVFENSGFLIFRVKSPAPLPPRDPAVPDNGACPVGASLSR